MSAKKIVYISAFTFLGILLQFLAHALLEIWYIGLLLKDFRTYGLGLSWSAWFLIHTIYTLVLIILGAWLGYRLGKYWWNRIYSIHE